MTYKIAYIGFGSIGQDVARLMAEEPDFPCVQLVLMRDGSKHLENLPNYVMPMFSFHKMLACKPDIVVEVASQEAVWTYASTCLNLGVPFLVTSVGALANEEERNKILAAAKRGQTKVIVPSGAIASLECLPSIHHEPDATVRYGSHKPTQAWQQERQDSGLENDHLSELVILDSGDVRTATLESPKSLNVEATLALAGLGMDNTQLKVLVDPNETRNRQILPIESAVDSLKTALCNQTSSNQPKTSWVVAQSVAASINKQFSSLLIA